MTIRARGTKADQTEARRRGRLQQQERHARQQQRRRRLLTFILPIAALITIGGIALAIRAVTAPPPAVTTVGGPNGNQLHQFAADHHAPFIALADYKPIYDRRDPRYVLVDVREAGERARAYIPGDIWAPLADADSTGWQALEKYRNKKTLVLYCDCPWAEAATESHILEAHGFSDQYLRVLHEGIPGWQQAGYPVVPGGDVCARQAWPMACSR